MSSIWKNSRLVSAIMYVITVQLSSAASGVPPGPPAHAERVPTEMTAAAIAPATRAIGERVTDIRGLFRRAPCGGVRLRIAFLDTIVA